jgi:Bacterial SH3 domain
MVQFLRLQCIEDKRLREFILKIGQIIATRQFQIILFGLWSFGCGIIPSSQEHFLPRVLPGSATSQRPGSTVEIKRTPGNFMLADSSPVYEHPDKASAIIAYVPQGAQENVDAGTGDWLLIRLPDGKVGFIPLNAVKQK